MQSGRNLARGIEGPRERELRLAIPPPRRPVVIARSWTSGGTWRAQRPGFLIGIALASRHVRRMIHVNARYWRQEDVVRLRVDRAADVQRLIRAVDRGANILVYGPRGVGKTFLLRMLLIELERRKAGVFPIYYQASLTVTHAKPKFGEEVAFKYALLFELISAVWYQLAQLPHIALAAAKRAEEIRFRSTGIIADIHLRLVSSERENTYQRSNTLGADHIIAAKLDEERSSKTKFGGVEPLELSHYIADLKAVIETETKCTRLLVLCDEANLLPEEWQRMLIGSHVAELSALGLQFVFVADRKMEFENVLLEDYFEVFHELKGIPATYWRQFVANHFPDDHSLIDQPIAKAVFRAFLGNPRICVGAFEEIINLTREREKKKATRAIASKAISLTKTRLVRNLRMLPPGATQGPLSYIAS